MSTPAASVPVALGTAITDGGIGHVNFFNGRLLTSGDLQREQQARRDADARLGQAAGGGVAVGLEVTRDGGAGSSVVKVAAGVAVTSAGQVLRLANDQVVTLVAPPAGGTPNSSGGFGPCKVLAGGVYVAGDGLYLLLLSPATQAVGKAPVLALAGSNVRCNDDLMVEGVQLRLLRVDGSALEPGMDTNVLGARSESLLRSAAAAACFGHGALAAVRTQAGATPADNLLQRMRLSGLGDCDVPLALVFVKGSNQIVWVDRWAVRRRVATPGAQPPWQPWLGESRTALAEAMLVQFQEHLAELPASALADPVGQWLHWLPPAGFLAASGPRAVNAAAFLGALAPVSEVTTDGAQAAALLDEALRCDALMLPAAARSLRVYRIGGASGMRLFVRDRRQRAHAEEVWLDGARATLPGVNDVQTAIDTLRRRSCAQVVLWEGADVVGILQGLSKGRPTRLCFEPGRYTLEKPLDIEGLSELSIEGAGAVLVLPGGESVLRVADCDSVHISGLAFEAGRTFGFERATSGINGALDISGTAKVRLHGVRARCAPQSTLSAAAIVVRGGSGSKGFGATATVDVQISDCEAEVGQGQVGILCLDVSQARLHDNRVLPAIAGKPYADGILVAGRTAQHVVLARNQVRSAQRGMGVGLSDAGAKDEPALQAGSVHLECNDVELNLVGAVPDGRYGLFVGNAEQVHAKGNRVRANRSDASRLRLHGLRLHGVYGNQILVQGNLFIGAETGIEFQPVGSTDGVEDQVMWAFEFNVLQNGAGPVFNARSQHGVVEQFNVPAQKS